MSASAREMKAGLDSKWGPSRFLQAREYRRSAKSAYHFAMVVLPCSLIASVSFLFYRRRQKGVEMRPILPPNDKSHKTRRRNPVSCVLIFPKVSSLTTVNPRSLQGCRNVTV